MPLASPNKGEEKSKFISRCMSDSAMQGEFPEHRQRLAVCHKQWLKKEEQQRMEEAADEMIERLRRNFK